VTSRIRRAGAGSALVVAGLTLAGCGGTASSATSPASSSTSSGTSSSASAAGTVSPAGTNLAITVKGATVTPAPTSVDVPVGTPVHLTVTADRTSEVHVHVLDLEKPITAGQPLTIDFTPTQQGVYEVELHDPDLLLVKLAVR
jgi:plastocyanin